MLTQNSIVQVIKHPLKVIKYEDSGFIVYRVIKSQNKKATWGAAKIKQEHVSLKQELIVSQQKI